MDFIRAILNRAKEGGIIKEWYPDDNNHSTSSMERIVTEEFNKGGGSKDQIIVRGEHVVSKKHGPLIILGLRALRIALGKRLIEAADENRPKRVQELINRGANVNASDKWLWTALHIAG